MIIRNKIDGRVDGCMDMRSKMTEQTNRQRMVG